MPHITIDDSNYTQFVNPIVAGERKICGTKPRDYSVQPHGCHAFAPAWGALGLPTIPRAEWQPRLDALKAAKAQLTDIRNTGNGGQPIPSRDQNGKGYCWAHSGVSAHLIARAKMGLPYADLSAYSVACMVKKFQDEGGWGSEGIEFQAKQGCATSKTWPQQSMSRGNDNPNTWAEAANYKMVNWVELDPQNMIDQLVTCLLLGWPVVTDFNWWSHSVCTVNLVNIDPLQTTIWNSWGDTWSSNGMGDLKDSKAKPDSAWAVMLTTPSYP